MSDAAAELHQAIIDDHRRRPRNRGPLPTANRVATRENPACGDRCTLHLRVEADRIAAATFTGAGCALSQASASLATVALAGLNVAETRTLAASIEALVRTGRLPAAADSTADATLLAPDSPLLALAAAHAFPARHACALLSWQAALSALDTASS